MNYKLKKIKPFGVLLSPLKEEDDITKIETNELKRLFYEHQLIVLRGFSTFKNSQKFSDYCENLGKVSVWPFGKVLELIEQENPKDHIFDHSYVPFHWDGMYREQVPEYQIFHCVKAPKASEGGRTVFFHSMKAAHDLPQKIIKDWSSVKGVYERKMEFYESKVMAPILEKHPFKDHLVIHYNEPHDSKNGKLINIPQISFISNESSVIKELKELKELKEKMDHLLRDPKYTYAHEWKDGDVVIADNFSLLHGREEFTSKASRHIQRVHVLSDPPFLNPHLEFYK